MEIKMKNKLFILGVSLVLLFAFVGCDDGATSCFFNAPTPNNVTAAFATNAAADGRGYVMVRWDAASYSAGSYVVVYRLYGAQTVHQAPATAGVVRTEFDASFNPTGTSFATPNVNPDKWFARIDTGHLSALTGTGAFAARPVQFGVVNLGNQGVNENASDVVWTNAISIEL
jgi:hypothetical protein